MFNEAMCTQPGERGGGGVRPDNVEEKERDPLSSVLIFPPPSLPHSPRA